ncbi:MAG TPA: cobalamin-independent methionine synthase II family protein [Solirubrobacteraceae bacterium]|jgi:5-methyltetrahydropteroyltriglutamate--homocysteine methyltransferase
MDRVLTTHTGSLCRPRRLAELITSARPGDESWKAELDEAIAQAAAEVVQEQAGIGLDVINDGEMGKSNWISYLYERTNGIESRPIELSRSTSNLPPSRDREAFPGFYREHDEMVDRARREAAAKRGESDQVQSHHWVCTGPLTYDPTAVERDIANLRAAAGSVEVTDLFLPVVAPASAYWLANEYYATDEEFVWAVADVLAEEYRHIVEAGILLQVDDAVLMHECDSVLATGGSFADYRRWAELRIEALNHALSGLPRDRIRYHVCWGSWHGPHAYDPPLRDVADLVFGVTAGYYLIEQANPRHEHEWRLFEEISLPEDSVLVPGVVTHHTNVVEHPELVADRLVRVAELVGRDHVMGGTDCGFAQSAFTQRVHPEIQWAKLRSLVEGAQIASDRLWGAS